MSAQGCALGLAQFRGRILGVTVDGHYRGLARDKAEARKGLQLLRRHLERPERPSGLQPLEASLECRALEVAGALFLLEPLVTPLGLLEVGEYQFGRDRLDRRSKRDLIARKLRNYDQQRVEIANQRNEAQVERRAFLLFLGIGREVEHRQLRGDEFLRVMGRREEI